MQPNYLIAPAEASFTLFTLKQRLGKSLTLLIFKECVEA